jgi:hypothetical protein
MPSQVECPWCERGLSGSKSLQLKFNVAFPGFLVKQAAALGTDDEQEHDEE